MRGVSRHSKYLLLYVWSDAWIDWYAITVPLHIWQRKFFDCCTEFMHHSRPEKDGYHGINSDTGRR